MDLLTTKLLFGLISQMVPQMSVPSETNPTITTSPSPVPSQQEKAPKNKKTIYTGLVILVSMVVLFWLSSSVLPKVLVYLTKAVNQSGQFSLVNSYIFGSPLVAESNGEEKIRVSAFLLDTKGRGVADEQISLNVVPKSGSAGQPQINEVQSVTDKFGKVVFEVTSTFAGQFIVSASVGGLEFPQTVTLTFR